ncbi:hypothetical protein ElyMa_007019500 [Elysia marginata]|uniref:Uncharacterized protein n=1 Tax=Elysia marginata TaxID=1093978 RepID=A0AAV4JTT6_9GAST|nr:hypothetical protein ElyMa_007019500 [Elysia marginata]
MSRRDPADFKQQHELFCLRCLKVILPIIGQDRLDSNDNTAEAEREVDVLEGPEVEISSCECELPVSNGGPLDCGVGSVGMELSSKTEDDTSKSKNDSEPIQKKEEPPPFLPAAEPDNKYYEVEAIIDGPKKRREHLVSSCIYVRLF